MSNIENDKENSETEGGEASDPTLSGKGWDILVGGKDNLDALGGSDPFDLTDAAGSSPAAAAKPARISKKVSTSKAQPIEAPPRDLSPEELGYQASSLDEDSSDLPAAEPPSTPVPAGSMPGLSAGVTVTPIVPTIIEVSPAVEAPSLPSIVEMPSSEVSVGGPVALPEGQFPEDVMTGPVAPTTTGWVPLSPAIPLWSVPQGIPIDDPFETQEEPPHQEEDAGGPELPPDETLAKTLITPERIDALWNEINETYDLVVNDVRGHFTTTQQALDHLKKARELLLSGHENFDNAEKRVKEVKSRLRLEEKVRQWSNTRGAWLAAYLILWLLLLSVFSMFTVQVQAIATQFVPEWMSATWWPALFGGLGGVIGALWVLNKHITRKRDFDPIHTLWYITNPFMGIALGVGTYVLVRGGGWVLASVAGSGEFAMTLPLTLTLAALCFVVGFNQNVLWALVDRFVKATIPSQEEQAVTEDTASSSSEKSSG